MQYQLPFRWSPWIGFNWRFDSGLVAGSAPCYNPLSNDPNSACADTSTTLNGQPAVDLSGLTADQQFEAGLTCGGHQGDADNASAFAMPGFGVWFDAAEDSGPGHRR